MPYDPINVGIDPDDVTGDLNRDAWIKVNSNFSAVDTQLAAAATAVAVAALDTELDDAVAALNDALALKQNISDPLDPGDGVAHFDAAQVISNTEKRQLIQNTGGHVVIQAEIVPPATTLAGTTTVKLPISPRDFYLDSIFITLTERTVGSGGTLVVGFSLDQGATVVASNAGTAIGANGILVGTLGVANTVIGGNATSFTLTVVDTETGAPIRKGAMLWMRGHWVT